MSAEQAFLEPEVDALLREVAADPRSILLRVPRKHALPILFRDDSDVGPMTAGLATIDRHLLAVHRSEVAELLRKVCLMRLLESQRGRICVSRYETADCEVLSPRLPELRQQALRGRSSRVRSDLALTGLDAALESLRGPTDDLPAVTDLASLSYRLHPTHDARILAAMDLSQRDSSREAVRLLLLVLKNHPSRVTAATAADNLGFAWNELGKLDRAFSSVKAALEYAGDRVTTCMNRLAFGIQLGDEHDILESDRRLRELISPAHPAVEFFMTSAAIARIQRRWSPTDAAAPAVRGVQSKLGEVATRIADVFISPSAAQVKIPRGAAHDRFTTVDEWNAAGPATQGLKRSMERYAHSLT
jgi:hypothetical protein